MILNKFKEITFDITSNCQMKWKSNFHIRDKTFIGYKNGIIAKELFH